MEQHIFKVRVVRSPAGTYTLYFEQADRVINSRGNVSQAYIPGVVLKFVQDAGLRFVGTIPDPEAACHQRHDFYVIAEEK